MIMRQEKQEDVVMGPRIVPRTDNPIPIAQLAKCYGIRTPTFRTYITRGRTNANKQLVKLQAVRMPYGLASTHKAYQEFIDLICDINIDGKSTITSDDWSNRRFIVEAGHALFRFSAVDLRWMLSKMKHDDVLRFELSKALEELQ